MTYIGPPASFDVPVSELVVLRSWSYSGIRGDYYHSSCVLRLSRCRILPTNTHWYSDPNVQRMGPKLYLRITSILSVVEATCDRTKSSQFTVCLVLQSFPYLLQQSQASGLKSKRPKILDYISKTWSKLVTIPRTTGAPQNRALLETLSAASLWQFWSR